MLMGVLAAAVFMGCQDRSIYPPQQGPYDGVISNYGGSAVDVTLDSAIFSIYVVQPSEQTVNAHVVTSFWDEGTVTWSNFAGSYSHAVTGSFVASHMGWYSVDITTIAQAWLNGSVFNFGLLLEQGDTPATMYLSSEDTTIATHPMLKLCFTQDGTPECLTIQRGTHGNVSDAFIWESFPNDNYGASQFLYSGLVDTLEKQTLVEFDLTGLFVNAAIGDFVWSDGDMNGIQDDGEAGIPDVTVQLFGCVDSMLAQTVTDGSGHYLFDELMPGEYYLHFILPDGWTFSPQDQGDNDNIDSDADPLTGNTICTVLDSGETDHSWDAGMFGQEQEGCTRSKGYWKNHAGFGPQPDVVTPLLPLWLGQPDSSSSLQVTTAQIAYDVLSQNVYGVPSNGITKLYAQLLAAKLNIANGASGDDVAEVIEAADAFLSLHGWQDWSSLSREQRQMVLGWKDTLDGYNNGTIGPGPCEEEEQY